MGTSNFRYETFFNRMSVYRTNIEIMDEKEFQNDEYRNEYESYQEYVESVICNNDGNSEDFFDTVKSVNGKLNILNLSARDGYYEGEQLIIKSLPQNDNESECHWYNRSKKFYIDYNIETPTDEKIRADLKEYKEILNEDLNVLFDAIENEFLIFSKIGIIVELTGMGWTKDIEVDEIKKTLLEEKKYLEDKIETMEIYDGNDKYDLEQK
ncbi:MAG: hypothetical protein ACRC4M_04585, partial [Mycoplasma sp.]